VIDSLFLAELRVNAGFRCLAIDADTGNHSLSFCLSDDESPAIEQRKTIFNLFLGDSVAECSVKVDEKTSLVAGDVRLNEFRSTDSLKRLKRVLRDVDYDFCVIDTSPAYDNITGNVLTASDILLIPVQQDMFSYQALKYQLSKLADLELDSLDTHIIFNQFEKPLTDNRNTYRNQITNLFLEDETFKPFINPNRLSRSSVFRKYINKRRYRIDGRDETCKSYGEIKNLIQSVLGVSIGEAL
jgi:chromosome partitioning protein